jgi:hypothetical protein
MKSILLSLAILTTSSVFATNTFNESLGSGNPVVSAFPNPASDRLFINISTSSSNGSIKIKVYDVLGKVVLNKDGNDTDGTGKSNNVIDVNEFFPGIYTVVIVDQSGQSSAPLRVMITR